MYGVIFFLFLLTVALRARAVSYLLTDGYYAMLLISCCDDTSPVSKSGNWGRYGERRRRRRRPGVALSLIFLSALEL